MRREFRKTQRWVRLRAHVLATHPNVCGYVHCSCPTGRAIDLDLPGSHRWGPTVDHIHEVEDGGDWWDEANLTPMHRSCNVSKGNEAKNRRRTMRASGHTIANDTSARSHHRGEGRSESSGGSARPRPASWSISLSESPR